MANEPQKWAGLLGSGADVNTIPEETPAGTGAASMKSIFPPITQVPLNAGGIAPDRADFNGLFKLLGDNIYYQQHGGVYSYSATIDYEKGSLAKFNDRFYIAIQSNGPSGTVADPTNAIFWKPITLGDDYLHIAGGDVEGNVTVEGLNVVRSVNGETADENGNVEAIGRLAALSFAGKLAFTVDPYAGQASFGRAIQGMAYDKNTNILYLTANYNHQGTFIFAYDYDTKECIGANYDASQPQRNAFYGAFEHQGIGLYRDQNNNIAFFSGGNRYTAPDVVDLSKCNDLNMIRWDYTNPNVFTVEKTWKLWGTDYQSDFRPNVAVSEDGTKIIALKKKTDGSYCFGIWSISEILNLVDNTVLEPYATIIDSPWGFSTVGQGVALDNNFIYCLNSSASYTPHYIRTLSLNNKFTYERPASWEGAELEGITVIEGECLGFLPSGNGTYHLSLGVSTTRVIDDVSYNDPFFYDMQKPGGALDNGGLIRLSRGATGTSADYVDLGSGTYYLPSGSMTDLSDGAWYLVVLSAYDVGPKRQIAYRGNTSNDVRTRIIGGNWEPLGAVGALTYTRGDRTFADSSPVRVQGHYYGNEASANERTVLELRSNRDTVDQSCAYITRFRQNQPQAEMTGRSFLSLDFKENNVRYTRCLTAGVDFSNGTLTQVFLAPRENDKNVLNLLGSTAKKWNMSYITEMYGGANNIDCAVDSMGEGYIRYSNGLQICYGSANCSQGGTSNNLPMPFKDSSYTLTATYTGANNSVNISVVRTDMNTFTLYQSYSADVLTADYIAIGLWK